MVLDCCRIPLPHMRRLLLVRSALSFTLVLTSIGSTPFAIAESGQTVGSGAVLQSDSSSSLSGEGTVVVDQKNGSGSDTIGKWTLILPGNKQTAAQGALSTIEHTPAGNYTIFLTLPSGASSTIRIYRNDILEKLVERPQASFTLTNGDTMHIAIHYTLTKVGLIAIESDPLGVDFTMVGPNNQKFSGTTPASYDGLAEGQYSVKYVGMEGCVTPAPKSLRLSANDRITFTMLFSCTKADEMRSKQQVQTTGNDQRVTITTDGKTTVLADVSKSDWFAQYVARVARSGILSGYRDDSGNLTGEFGPGNPVTIAELAKISHALAGMSTDAFQSTVPANKQARSMWFSQFIASAENRGWTIYEDATIDPTRSATRAEVVETLLQALDIPIRWQHGSLFTDVTVHTPYAAAIETAAADNVIQGRNDATGTSLHLFVPNDPINRAEMAKVLSSMIDEYRNVTLSSEGAK